MDPVDSDSDLRVSPGGYFAVEAVFGRAALNVRHAHVLVAR